MMKKALIGTTALAIVACAVAVPNKADAHVWWLWPAVIAGGTGVVVGGAAASQAQYQGGRGNVYVQPLGSCRYARERGPDGTWRQVQICG
jgi:hypothetical protein